ncbi:MAG: hypothetical protein Q9218_008073 [Villophora microphyllina]
MSDKNGQADGVNDRANGYSEEKPMTLTVLGCAPSPSLIPTIRLRLRPPPAPRLPRLSIRMRTLRLKYPPASLRV